MENILLVTLCILLPHPTVLRYHNNPNFWTATTSETTTSPSISDTTKPDFIRILNEPPQLPDQHNGEIERLAPEPRIDGIETIKISTDDLDSEHCNKTVDVVQETRYNETMYCHESEGRECWSNYQTEVDVIQVEVCDDSFEKTCIIDYNERIRSIQIEVCKNIPERDCSGLFNKTHNYCDSYAHEIVCERLFHKVEETIPQCSQVLVRHCHDGIDGETCTELPRTDCTLLKMNITKYSQPDVNCKKSTEKVCVSSKCPVTYNKECHTFIRQKVVSFPEETCEIKAVQKCRMESKLIPRIVVKPQCVNVPRTVCEKIKVPVLVSVNKIRFDCNEPPSSTTTSTTANTEKPLADLKDFPAKFSRG